MIKEWEEIIILIFWEYDQGNININRKSQLLFLDIYNSNFALENKIMNG